ncbi:hypothetical protein PRZ48_012463 [Zasmidium cellare]|uniref:Heterokaryon incompatibility domain-containing protein n=1 Tax=Zasmidium cellare TaxID=395010 RepID=A0ABR0E5V4_ZASCE|nr:hypothetical protein PRZ48_012463 [Zasmidium cellare]
MPTIPMSPKRKDDCDVQLLDIIRDTNFDRSNQAVNFRRQWMTPENTIFKDPITDSKSLPHQQTFTDLKVAAISGCQICFAFWNQFSDAQQQELCERESGREQPCTYYFFDTQRIHYAANEDDYNLWVTNEDIPRSLATHSVVAFTVSPVDGEEVDSNSKLAIPQSSSTSSNETWHLIQQWRDRCNTTHQPFCEPPHKPTWYPTRLLHLDHTRQRARLLETSRTHPTGQYLTLSYRWQNIPSFLLTKKTHQTLVEGFPISSMPHVFRDAVTVCSHLGIALLWIDALCIMQDRHDQSDWRKESLQMDRVYSNAYLNIFAAAATDGRCSLFSERNPAILRELVISAAFNGGKEMKYRMKNIYFWRNEVEIVPLNLRGWVFQERLLAQRVLRFGKNQVTWECACTRAAEAFPNGVPSGLRDVSSGIAANFIQHLQKVQDELREDGRRDIYQTWDRLVDAYSQCSLTKPGDKLVALAGIAKVFSSFAKTRYVAGLWREDLENGLLWSVNFSQHEVDHPSRRSKVYRAPSWTWASVDGSVWSMSFMPERETWEVLDVSLDLASEDEMSPIKTAHLLLKCDVLGVTVSKDGGYGERTFFFTGPDGESKSFRLYVYWDEYEDHVKMGGQQAYLASAGFWVQTGSLLGHGLLLVHVGDGTYRRCAYWQTADYWLDPETIVAKMLQRALKQAAEIPCIRREGDASVVRLV